MAVGEEHPVAFLDSLLDHSVRDMNDLLTVWKIWTNNR